jgi:hypothetical protein
MKWLPLVGIALEFLLLAVVVLGAITPRDHVARVRARIAATPKAIWRAITDFGAEVKPVALGAPASLDTN